MQNIELKARYEEFDFARKCIEQLGGTFRRTIVQKDIYFDCERGRLKLRLNSDEDNGELIFYQRDDQPGPRESQYQIYLAPEPARLEAMLRAAYNVRTVVEKTRELYTIDNVLRAPGCGGGTGRLFRVRGRDDARTGSRGRAA
ncbi:MAG: class IV adenylate cyclase [candidate division KSB1 bacterium]|nr:class IV adenylate cyclase [candidate division KSB1 bacterium]